jgi:tetratricopeptide (TPR) repeat protein
MSGKYDESEQVLCDIPPHATLVPFYNVFGGIHARRGEWQEALTNWNRVVQYAPQDHVGYMYLAPLLLQLNDAAAFKNLRAQILQHFGNTSDPRTAERMVKASLILPATDDDMATIAKMADVATQIETNADGRDFNLFAKGFAEYRLGHYATAAEWLKQVISLDPGSSCRAETFLVLAMAQAQLDQTAASHESWTKAMDATKSLRKVGHLEDDWNDWIIAHVLLREAATLLQPVPAQL